MAKKKFDAIIIGTGQAGPSLAGRLTAAGMSVAIAERDKFGGSCVNVGCIPTKTLIASARAAHVARTAEDYGVVINGEVSVDMKKVKARKDEVSGASNKGVEGWLKGMDNLTVYEGHARFVDDRTVRVGDELIEADKIFINVGMRAYIPPLDGIERVDYMTNSGMMEIDFLPEHLIVIGGSYIGLEFAQMYRRFGSKVTVIEMSDQLISREDEDIAATVKEILEDEGIHVELLAECIHMEKEGDKIVTELNCEGEIMKLTGSHLLLATGRTPNTDDLGLEHTGIETDDKGFIKVDDRLRSSAEGIWAMGDCNGKGAFTHTSYNDFEIVAANVLDDDPRKVSDRILCYGLFIDPPLARIGMTKKQVRESGRKALIGRRNMTRVGRAREKGETKGFMECIVDANTKEILGAAILGVDGDEAIHCILDVMYAKAPYTVIQRAMHIHPTVAELIPTILGELQPLE